MFILFIGRSARLHCHVLADVCPPSRLKGTVCAAMELKPKWGKKDHWLRECKTYHEFKTERIERDPFTNLLLKPTYHYPNK